MSTFSITTHTQVLWFNSAVIFVGDSYNREPVTELYKPES